MNDSEQQTTPPIASPLEKIQRTANHVIRTTSLCLLLASVSTGVWVAESIQRTGSIPRPIVEVGKWAAKTRNASCQSRAYDTHIMLEQTRSGTISYPELFGMIGDVIRNDCKITNNIPEYYDLSSVTEEAVLNSAKTEETETYKSTIYKIDDSSETIFAQLVDIKSNSFVGTASEVPQELRDSSDDFYVYLANETDVYPSGDYEFLRERLGNDALNLERIHPDTKFLILRDGKFFLTTDLDEVKDTNNKFAIRGLWPYKGDIKDFDVMNFFPYGKPEDVPNNSNEIVQLIISKMQFHEKKLFNLYAVTPEGHLRVMKFNPAILLDKDKLNLLSKIMKQNGISDFLMPDLSLSASFSFSPNSFEDVEIYQEANGSIAVWVLDAADDMYLFYEKR